MPPMQTGIHMLDRSKRTKHKPQSLLQKWKELSRKEQLSFLGNLVRRKRYREDLQDLIDIAICEERLKEPTRPLEDIIKERRKRVHRKKT